MDAAHPMPHGNIDSQHEEQLPAASTFGAMRLVCRELNDKVFKRYVQTLFSVHTVMLEELSLRTLFDMGKNEHFRNALGTIFIDKRPITCDLPSSPPKKDMDWLKDIINDQIRGPGITASFLQILSIFLNLKEITIKHITVIRVGFCHRRWRAWALAPYRNEWEDVLPSERQKTSWRCLFISSSWL